MWPGLNEWAHILELPFPFRIVLSALRGDFLTIYRQYLRTDNAHEASSSKTGNSGGSKKTTNSPYGTALKVVCGADGGILLVSSLRSYNLRELLHGTGFSYDPRRGVNVAFHSVLADVMNPTGWGMADTIMFDSELLGGGDDGDSSDSNIIVYSWDSDRSCPNSPALDDRNYSPKHKPLLLWGRLTRPGPALLLALTSLVVLGLFVLRHQRDAAEAHRRSTADERWDAQQALQLTPPRAGPGCTAAAAAAAAAAAVDPSAQQQQQQQRPHGAAAAAECWAGVYYDLQSQTSLLLSRVGRATVSGAHATTTTTLWWYASAGGAPVHSAAAAAAAGAGAGAAVGAGAASDRSPRTFFERKKSSLESAVRLVEDMEGFVFPDSAYELWRPSEGVGVAGGEWVRVALRRDCSIVSPTNPSLKGMWPGCKTPQRTPSLTLEIHNGTAPAAANAAAASLAADPPLAPPSQLQLQVHRLWTADHGGEWWEDPPEGAPAGARPVLVLRLEQPTLQVSLFPATDALRPYLEYLADGEGDAQGPAGPPLANKPAHPPPILRVMAPQLEWRSGERAPSFPFLIVLGTGLQNPGKDLHRFQCKIGERWSRAWWVSWSMAVCAVPHDASASAAAAAPLSLWLDGVKVADDYEVDAGTAIRPRHAGLWLAQQGLSTNGRAWDHHNIRARSDDAIRPRHAGLWLAQQGLSTNGRAWDHHDIGCAWAQREWAHLGPPRHKLWLVQQGLSTNGRARDHLDMSVCATIKGEAPYLDEWIAYHTNLGVRGATARVLEPWVRRGLVTVELWPHVAAQTQALTECLNRHRHSTRWMTFIDVDEFIDPAPARPIAEPRHAEDLLPILEPNGPDRGADVHCMPWVAYCARGQLEPPADGAGVLASYPDVAPVPAAVKQRIHMQKPIFRAAAALALRAIGPHFLLYATSDPAAQCRVNLKCPHPWEDPSVLRLRHYRARSRAEFVARRRGADAAYKGRHYNDAELRAEWDEENARCVPEQSLAGNGAAARAAAAAG
ncbi:hypothetical protein JKP88DRAFT_275614 [Tribonema minus]|uniref:Glycosyltransferase family 92 protein n=1 Tax=Tribonema minus TaxID=303371 RepID=A0A835Z8H1_9STRA|nr:hypothetical protein JKP88DRAFT_275614 [Tribonema minus]